MAEVPHLSVPLRLSGTHLAEDEQDGSDEVAACVLGIMRTPVGWRVDLPEFGTPDEVHELGGANLGEIERSVSLWEERVDVVALRESGQLAELAAGLDRVTVRQRPPE